MVEVSQTSEQRYGLPKQPPDTCPMIDEVLKRVDDLRPDFEGVDRYLKRCIDRDRPEDNDTANDLIDDLVYRLEQADEARDNLDTRPVHRKMEEVRANVIDIREWGQSWKELAKARIERTKTLRGALELWWDEREHDRLTRWLRQFALDRAAQEPYRVAI